MEVREVEVFRFSSVFRNSLTYKTDIFVMVFLIVKNASLLKYFWSGMHIEHTEVQKTQQVMQSDLKEQKTWNSMACI